MDSDKNLLLEEYKVYVEHKEKFVDRSFVTNKFYMVLVLALILIMFSLKDCQFLYGLSPTLIFSVAGMAICILWWINMDCYNFLIKVKLSKVLEEIEKQLPVQPYTQEYSAIKERSKNKREFLFADMQKGFATLVFLFFFVIFINSVYTLFFAG